jgi:pimeloyl-ACP methyl ester carboxylesterase
MSTNSFEYEGAVVQFEKYGNGPKTILAFHGFGQDKFHYQKIAQVLNKQYTFYSFDLFFHGASFWHKKDKPIHKDFWIEMMRLFMKHYHIEKASFMGFSMGGRFAMALTEGLPAQTEELILIAPDGVKRSPYYVLATSPGFMRRILRSLVINPTPFKWLTNLAITLHLADKSIVRFAETQMNTREKRRRVYYSWVVFRKISFDQDKLAQVVNDHAIKVTMFLGMYDKMMTLKQMAPFLNKISNEEVHSLEAGHTNILHAVAEYYQTFILENHTAQ